MFVQKPSLLSPVPCAANRISLCPRVHNGSADLRVRWTVDALDSRCC